MKVKWFCTTAPNSNFERSSAQKKLALSLYCSDLHRREGGMSYCFAHLNCCLLAVFLLGRGTKGMSVPCFLIIFLYYFWALIYICCGLEDTCVSMKKAVGELSLAGVNIPLEGTVEGPWTVWTDCYYQREWMLFVCLCMCATQQALLWRQPCQFLKFRFLLLTPLPTLMQAYIGLVFIQGLGLAQNIRLLRKEH